MSIYKQREADSKSYGFSTPSFSVPRHKPMLNPNRSLNGFMFGKVPIQHRGTMSTKPAPIRRTESPKGASPDSRSVRRTKDDEPTEHDRAGPCVPEGGEYRLTKTDSCVSTDGRPLRGRSFRYWTARRFVGQALLAYGYSDSPPPGTLLPTRGSGTTDPYDTEGRCRRNIILNRSLGGIVFDKASHPEGRGTFP